MGKFVSVGNGTYVNIGEVRRIEAYEKEVIIHMKNGNVMTADIYFLDSLVGSNAVVQIIPMEDIGAIYCNSKNKEYTESLVCLAVCADGRVRGMTLVEDEICFADKDSDFKRYRWYGDAPIF